MKRKVAQWVLIVRLLPGPTAEIAVNRKCTKTNLAGQEGSPRECVEGKGYQWKVCLASIQVLKKG